MKRYVFILFAIDGGEIDRTIVNANDRKEAVGHMRMYIRGGRKFKCFQEKINQ
jgi:hypothetical protein